jgi:hypothetical protein
VIGRVVEETVAWAVACILLVAFTSVLGTREPDESELRGIGEPITVLELEGRTLSDSDLAYVLVVSVLIACNRVFIGNTGTETITATAELSEVDRMVVAGDDGKVEAPCIQIVSATRTVVVSTEKPSCRRWTTVVAAIPLLVDASSTVTVIV